MLTYAQLDHVADAYNPLLGMIWLFLVARPLLRSQWSASFGRFALGLSCLLIAYGLMLLDHALSLWPFVGLDYSTHTAVAVAFAVAIISCSPGSRIAVAASLLAYFGLMLYQQYHTVLDIFSTLLVVAGPMAGMAILYKRLVLHWSKPKYLESKQRC